jgi:uncharacterized FlaG/YvyC family protein
MVAMKKTEKVKKRLNDHLKMLEKLATTKMEMDHLYGSMKSPNFSGMPGAGDKRTSEEERLFLRMQELQKQAEKKQAEIDKDWAELEEMVEQLNPIETLVINLRYRYGGEWDDVCFSIFGKHPDYEIEVDSYQDKTFKAHGRALLAMANMMLEREVLE